MIIFKYYINYVKCILLIELYLITINSISNLQIFFNAYFKYQKFFFNLFIND